MVVGAAAAEILDGAGPLSWDEKKEESRTAELRVSLEQQCVCVGASLQDAIKKPLTGTRNEKIGYLALVTDQQATISPFDPGKSLQCVAGKRPAEQKLQKQSKGSQKHGEAYIEVQQLTPHLHEERQKKRGKKGNLNGLTGSTFSIPIICKPDSSPVFFLSFIAAAAAPLPTGRPLTSATAAPLPLPFPSMAAPLPVPLLMLR